MEKEWTFDQPTEKGFYWLEEGIKELKIVNVTKSFFSEKLIVAFHGSEESMELSYMKGLKWCGPITPPPTGRMKEKNNEESDNQGS